MRTPDRIFGGFVFDFDGDARRGDSRETAQHVAALLERLGAPQRETLLVGESLATNLGMAKTAGMAGALVLTGAPGADEALSSPTNQTT